jgi:hypothetical protein
LGQLTPAGKDFYNLHGAEFTCIRARGNKVMQTKLIITTALLLGLAAPAHAANLFVLGSTFTVNATNSPDSFSDTVNLTPGTQSLDGGAVDLNISIVNAGGGGEWLVFNYTTTNGGPLSGDDYWSVNQVGLDAAVPVNFNYAYSEFLVSGVAQPWSYSFFGGYTPTSSPVPGMPGTGVGNPTSFNSPQGSGPLGSLGAYIDPYSGYLSGAGIDPTMVNGYTQALEFSPTTPVPELSTWAMMLAGFAGLGFMSWRGSRKTAAHAA